MTRRSAVFCRTLSLFAVSGAFAFSAASAHAQGSPTDPGFSEQRNDSGAAVVFKDDPMSAGGTGPTPDIVRGRRPPSRPLLLRPRYNFVSEMLKSVENI